VAGEDRFCLVTPYSESINASLERDQVLRWGAVLASAFIYLHQNGLTYNGQFGEEAFSLSDGNAVIASFYSCQVGNTVKDTARVADLQALAAVIFKWLTGRKGYAHDPGLTPPLNNFFETALNPPGFSTAETFAQAFDEARNYQVDTRPVDHKLGRLTDVGIARSLNEDSLLTIQVDKFLESMPQPLGVYVVADGMGGHSAGEVASGTIVNTIANQAFSELLPSAGVESLADRCKWIDQVVQNANKAVFDLGKKMSSDMGSTIVMAVVEGKKVCIGHVGDSRAYQVNAKEITALTTDHSLVERLIDTGQIKREEARNHPQRNVIYRTMGDKEEVKVETASYTLNLGDRLLLCSDGLNGMVEDRLIHQIIMEEGLSPQAACEKLIEAANTAGGDDNITVVLLEFA
jgi:serine/threonine protein phosphatase PrpC